MAIDFLNNRWDEFIIGASDYSIDLSSRRNLNQDRLMGGSIPLNGTGKFERMIKMLPCP